MRIPMLAIGISKVTQLKRCMYSHKVALSYCFNEKRLSKFLWHCLLSAKWWKNIVLNSSKEWIEIRFNRLNHSCVEPVRVVRRTQHFTPCEYWCNRIAFLNRHEWASKSEVSLYSPIYKGRKWLDNPSSIISSEKGCFVKLILLSFYPSIELILPLESPMIVLGLSIPWIAPPI